MTLRKEETIKTYTSKGGAVNVRILDGIFIEDLLIQGMKAEGFRVITGSSRHPNITRDLKDFLIKLGVVSE